MSGRARAASSGPGILNPIAGTTTQSTVAAAGAETTGTVNPCDVLTDRRSPTSFTSNLGATRPESAASSFAV